MLQFIDALSYVRRTVIIAVLLLAGVASLGLNAASIHWSGRQIVLATMPVDPRSLFQGDYVILNYQISSLSKDLFDSSELDTEIVAGQSIYVELQPGAAVWTPARASLRHIAPSGENVVIQGRLEYIWAQKLGDAAPLRVKYGIESFLVPEGEGLAIEQLRNASDRVTVRVSVVSDGAALPQNILVDGKPVFIDSGM